MSEKLKRMKYIQYLMGQYAKNPSNSNKYYQEMLAIVFDDDWHGMDMDEYFNEVAL